MYFICVGDNGTCDRPIVPSNQNQYIVWGIGSLGESAFQPQVSGSRIAIGCPGMSQVRGTGRVRVRVRVRDPRTFAGNPHTLFQHHTRAASKMNHLQNTFFGLFTLYRFDCSPPSWS